MVFAGFSFKKISVEKSEAPKKGVKVDLKININDVTKTTFKLENRESLIFHFIFSVNYTPKIAELTLAGELIFVDEPKIIKKVLEEWKDKKLDDKLRFDVLNFIMTKCNIKALSLEEEMGLPLHIPLPRLKPEDKKK